MKHLVRRALLALMLATTAVQAQTPPVDEREKIFQQARDAMWWGDFETLDRLHAQYQRPGQATASDGRSRLGALRRGMASPVGSRLKARDGYFQQVDAITLQWTRQHPDSAWAHVLHAEALLRHAFAHRGSEYAHKVPPEAWREFKRHVDMAIGHLAEHKAVAMRSSSAHVTLIELGKLAGWDHAMLWSVATQGLAINPEDDGLKFSMVGAVLPKWGGSAVLLDRTINDLVRLDGARHGDIYYARLYAAAAEGQFDGPALFSESDVDWTRMKVGFRQFVERFPAAVNVNEFAYYACMARDKPTLQELLERVGPKPLLASWGGNAARTFEGCRRWAAEV